MPAAAQASRRSLWPGAALGLLCGLALLGMASGAYAGPTRYVTDQFTINLRTGAGNQYRILKLLPTGAAVEVLEAGSGWTRIEADNGQQGWVPSQYLISEPPAAQRLQQIKAKLAQMQGTQQQLTQARARIQQLTSERDRLAQQVDASRAGLTLATENKRLKQQIIGLKRRLQNLANEIERLSERSRQDWFLVGAGVLLAGMLAGIIMTRIRWRRRSAWGDL